MALTTLAMLSMALTQVATVQAQFEGLDVQKATQSPAPVGSPYLSRYQITNNTGTGNTLQITAISDTVFGSGGNVTSPPGYLADLELVFTDVTPAPPVCTGGSGSGTVADPRTSAPPRATCRSARRSRRTSTRSTRS